MFHFLTLPNNLDKNLIVRLLQNNMAAYQLEYPGNHIVTVWKETKKERARKRKQKEIRKKAEKMVRLRRLEPLQSKYVLDMKIILRHNVV